MRNLVVAIAVCGCSLMGQSKGVPEKLTPMNPAVIESALAAQTSGNFNVTFNITVKSTLPATAVISCALSASVYDGYPSTVAVYQEAMTVQATGTGATRTCTLNLFYSWPLLYAGADTVGLGYTVQTGTAMTTLMPRRVIGDVNGTFSMTGAHTLTIPITL